MNSRVRVGLGLEFHSSQHTDLDCEVDFIEYGLHSGIGIPAWVLELRDRVGADLTLHPLDLNFSVDETLDDAYLDSLGHEIKISGARALVSDALYWYLGDRGGTWPRPNWLSQAFSECQTIAKRVAGHCGIPFRIENPPAEALPDKPDIWSFLERSTNDSDVQICLDLAHLLQLEWNVFERTPVLPRDFPWHRVSEIHLSGNLTVEYLGRSFILNEHDVDIDVSQYALLGNILSLPGLGRTVDVCLEMEPRHPNAVQGAKKRLTALLHELK